MEQGCNALLLFIALISYENTNSLKPNYIAMKKLFLLFTLLLFAFQSVFGSTLIVKQDAPVGFYSTIQSAIDAAVDGDSVVVNQRYDAFPWRENLSIAKNIIIVSGVDSTRWQLEGNIDIIPGAGRNITLLGAEIFDYNGGQIRSTIPGASATDRSVVNIIDCKSRTGGYAYYFPNDNFDINIISSWTNGHVLMRHGSLLGSWCWQIEITAEANASSANDSIVIVGNVTGPIYFNSYESMFISNNNVRSGLSIGRFNISRANRVLNNTFNACGSYSTIYFNTNYNIANILIANNLSWAWNCGLYEMSNIGNSLTSNINFKYNAFLYGYSSGTPVSTINQGNSTFTYYFQAGASAPSAVIDDYGRLLVASLKDKGYYLGEYSDIDLTRNDVGTYGGSYSINNYWPDVTSSMGKGRVHWLDMPHLVNTTATPINVTGEAHSNY